MVHLGKPSRGCAVCRQFHRKCDEAVPSCSYCLKRQIKCPGYRNLFDLAWRDQTAVAERSVKRRIKASEKATHAAIKLRQMSDVSLVARPKPLKQDLEGYALDFFLPRYIVLPKDPDAQRSFLECLHPVWKDSESGSPLRPAVAAVAFWMLEGWSQLRPGTPSSLSHSHYLKGIAALRNHLLRRDGVDDTVILAALMLDMYDNLQSFSVAKENQGPHVRGVAALIEQRAKLPLTTELSQKVLLGARQHIITRALASKGPVPASLKTMNNTLRNFPLNSGYRQDELNIDIANLQNLVAQVQSNSAESLAYVLDLLEQATDLDQRLLEWESMMPVDWTPFRLFGAKTIPPNVQRAGLYQEYCEIYKSIHICHRINLHRSSRTKVQLMILDCLAFASTNAIEKAGHTAVGIIQQLADGICATVPYHLGDRTSSALIDDKTVQYPHVPGCPVPDDHHLAAAAFAGFQLSNHLGELLSLRVPLRAGQKQWIGGQMLRIKAVYDVEPS